MRRALWVLGGGALLACCALLVGASAADRHGPPGDVRPVGRAPRLVPDYAGVTIPPNIAPLNFRIDEPGSRCHARFTGPSGAALEVDSRDTEISIPAKAWHRLLKEAEGGKLSLEIAVQKADGPWAHYDPVEIEVARSPIDPYVVYRLMDPIYRIVVQIDIRQRSLEGFGDTALVSAKSFDGCVNCHAFPLNAPDRMVLHMRSGDQDFGAGMLLITPDAIRKIRTSTARLPGLAAFTSWHPNRHLVAFSVNSVRQFFHTARTEVRDFLDLKSDLAIYDFDSGTVTSTAAIARPDRLETFPCWAPDGRHLYYSSAPVLWEGEGENVSIDRYAEVRYSIERVPYDPATGEWGESEVVLDAGKLSKSITQPRISPDGRFMVTCMTGYSAYPSLQGDADLYLTDLRTGETHRMECNSPRTESWHSWSSNSRWLAFSSKRADGHFIRIYFAYVDENGRAGKPFVLPQKSPSFYDSFIRLNQLPELITGPVQARGDRVANAIRTGGWEGAELPVTGATVGVAPERTPAPGPYSSGHQ
jgi:hypothetical protein